MPLSDEQIEKAWLELEAKRRQWDLEGLDQGEDFTTKILGGRWTREHKGRSYDAIIGIASKGAASDWCRQYGLNIEASFSYRKYGEGPASSMAVHWCKRMQHFFNLYKERDDPMMVYKPSDLDSCEDDLDFVNMILAAGMESPVWARAQAIRNLRPSAHPGGSASASSSKA